MDKDSQKLWRLTKTLNDDNIGRSKVTLQIGQDLVTGKMAANVLAQSYREESETKVSRERTKEVREKIEEIKRRTPDELDEALTKLKKKKAPGPDGITNEMLIHLGKDAKKVLLKIYNQSWKYGIVPSKWKEAIIVPIHKKGKDKRSPKSYRPISLLSCVGKLMERIINKRLVWHLESNSILNPTQTGYRQNRSTEDQLAYLAQQIENAFQDKKHVLAVFFDLSKAFDKVWKEGLILKLLEVGVKGKMHHWIQSFLQNRHARVKLDGTTSNLVNLREGVPQGGVISPTLFLIYINNITAAFENNISDTLHADDLAAWAIGRHISTVVNRAQTMINQVEQWAKDWFVDVNIAKMASILFSLSTQQNTIELQMGSQPIPQVDSTVFLGGNIDKRLTWKPHIQLVQERAIKKLALMRKLAGTTWGATTKILRQIYIGAVRPIMEYASATWTTASKSAKDKLDKVQNMGLRLILGGMRSTPIRDMEKTTTIQPLEMRRQYKTLIQGEKMKRLTSHPMHQELQKQPKNRLKRKSILHATRTLQEEHRDILTDDPRQWEVLKTNPWTSDCLSPEIESSVPDLKQKGTQPTEIQKALAQEMIDQKYPQQHWTLVYTDGSSQNAVRNGGSGVFIKFPDQSTHSIASAAGELCSNYRAEIQALTIASEYLITAKNTGDKIVLLTDSLSALQALRAPSADQLTENLKVNLSLLQQSRRTVLQWIPAHVGIPGNEKADQLAKEGSRMQQPNTSMTYNEARTLIKAKQRTRWSDETDGYSRLKDSIHQLERRGQVIIYRLRTGHCRLNQHMRKLGLRTSANCECGLEEQSPKHILQTCPKMTTSRQHFWPVPTSIETQLWGTVVDLQRTVDYVQHHGINV